jgi:hypothetical protein
LLVLEIDTCKDGSECVIVIIVFRYVIYIVTKFIKKIKKKIKKIMLSNFVCMLMLMIRSRMVCATVGSKYNFDVSSEGPLLGG